MEEYERIREFFEANNSEYIEFGNVKEKRSNRPDLHAFLLLDELFPGDHDIVEYAQHDEIYLSTSLDDIVKISNEHLLELIRCGVCFDDEGLRLG